MTTADLLIEIGTEELPPKSLLKLAAEFRQGVAEQLAAARLEHGAIRFYATPRRLALIVEQLAATQPDQQTLRRGPSVSAAYDESGEPTRAALGFASANGVKVEELEELRTDKGAWLSCVVTQVGQPLSELLPALLESALAKLPVDRRMRWGSSRTEFVRPVHWITLLHGESPLAATILGQQAADLTYGHRFMAPAPLKLASANEYVEALRGARVIADFDERRAVIRSGLESSASTLGGTVVIDEALLDEVTSLVEWPVVLPCRFEEEFLEVPKEVLISAMKDHQRYFHTVNNDGELLASFLIVANIESSDPSVVIAGNEKVIRPRLADAAFFYRLDAETTLESHLERLKGVLFQSQLGTYYEKATRIAALAGWLAEQLHDDTAIASRAGLLCKADLASSLVNEFPDLQGVMGSYYATNDGEEGQVSAAIKEQYLPAFSGDRLPESSIGTVVSLAEKLDTLVGLFGIKQPPTGSRDPFGLRRAAIGVLRIMIDGELAIDLRECLEHAASLFEPMEFSVEPLVEYFLERLNYSHQEQGVSPEVFQAVKNCRPLVAGNECNLVDLDRRMRAVSEFRHHPSAVALSEANKRVSNILLKQASAHQREVVDLQLLKEAAEITLHARIGEKQEEIRPLLEAGSYLEALTVLAELQEFIDDFFDSVLVMDEDSAVRENRLALLYSLRQQFLEIADVSHLHTV